MTFAKTRAKQDACPNVAEHTYGPDGYVQWHAWAEEMSKSHTQQKCPGCGFFLIVRPRDDWDEICRCDVICTCGSPP